MASAGADAHSQSPASVRSMRGSLVRTASGATELVRKSNNVSRTHVAALNVGDEVVLPQVKRHRTWLQGRPRTTSDVGIIVSERFRDSIISAERSDDRSMKIVVAARERLFHFFLRMLRRLAVLIKPRMNFGACLMRRQQAPKLPSKDVIVVAGDRNGHVGATKDGYSCNGGFGYVLRKP
ncbi:unnamed protein product [Heligmosomoides polygyrus]|uniref:S1-like domain-containing protein n=1 Tax=Heligmosomoides polygyrus TaxID=6339 RepID=A0A183FLT8_HELPZ|nr:unnamed protein product [Heligmosomoides polygyrus]